MVGFTHNDNARQPVDAGYNVSNPATVDNSTKILVCDDDMMVRLLARECLEEAGMSVVDAADGDEAIAMFALEQPDLVFLDVDMPGKTGFEVCQEIRATAHGKNVPVLIATGADDKASIDHGFKVGATQYKTKPVNWTLLSRDIRYMLRASQAFLELKSQEDKLRYFAYFDQLTDLPNRRSFSEQLNRHLVNAQPANAKTGLIVFGIDHFKRINDSCGYERGDQLLCRIAQCLQDHLRATGYVISDNSVDESATEQTTCLVDLARIGGDEFSILVRNAIDEAQLQTIASEVLKALAEPMSLESQQLVVSPSLGIALAPVHGETPAALLRNATAALSAAKTEGGARLRIYDESLNNDAQERILLETELRAALSSGEHISMVYQPQIDTATGKIAGVEALVRWNHPELGPISPAKFIPIAESSGLIIPLSDMIMRKINDDVRLWSNKFPVDAAISVNVSPVQFTQSNFVAHLKEMLKELDAHFKVELELTEGVVMSDASTNLSKLEQLKEAGFDLAIDDFGTGYSSLSYLRQFPIDTLKIDRSFVMDLGTTDGDVIVKAILSLSHALGLRIVAEGVETMEQAQFLCANGCTLLQGYLLAKPLTLDQLADVATKDFSDQLSAS